MTARRRPSRSVHGPTMRVVTVAAIALAATMPAMTDGSGVMTSYTNTLRYMFSTVQATWPVSPTITMASQSLPPGRVRSVSAAGAAVFDAVMTSSILARPVPAAVGARESRTGPPAESTERSAAASRGRDRHGREHRRDEEDARDPVR